MRSAGRSPLGEDGGADGLHRKRDQHTTATGQEQEASTQLITQKRCGAGNCQIPDLQNTVDEQLDGRVGDADGVQDLSEVV